MWKLVLPIDETLETPLFLQIARHIADRIQAGQVQPGERLPGSRSLAKTLSVHRNTVLAAYDELASQGWLTRQEARGTFVSQDIPGTTPATDGPTTHRLSSTLGYPLPMPSLKLYQQDIPKHIIALAGGMPDLSEFPVQEWSRAYRRSLRLAGTKLLGYGDPAGYLPLRKELAQMLTARRGLAIGPKDILLTRGAQMALSLVANTLLRPGDTVAVEAYGYEPAWTALRIAGAHLTPIPVDQDGLITSELEALLQHTHIRAIYTTPHHQYPTQAHLSAGRRLHLLELAQKHQFAIIEDDYDHEFHYDGHPILPLASNDTAGVVIYIGSLSKVLAPSLRVGYVVAPPPLIDAMTRLRRYVDRQGAQVEEAALTELMEEGLIERHTRRMKRLYQLRRDALVAALATHLPDTLSFVSPKGGMSLWAHVTDGTDVEEWQRRAWEAGVFFAHGGSYIFDRRPRPYLRLGFALHKEALLQEGVLRMKQAHLSLHTTSQHNTRQHQDTF